MRLAHTVCLALLMGLVTLPARAQAEPEPAGADADEHSAPIELRAPEPRDADLERADAEAAAPPPTVTQPSPLGWVFVGVGVAAGVTASVTGILAIEISESLARDCTGGICPAARRFDADLGRNLALSTDALIPISVAALGVGALLVLLVREEIPPALELEAGCDPEGCVARLAGSF